MSTKVTLSYAGGRQWYRVPSDYAAIDVDYNIVGGGGAGGGRDSHVGGDGGGASAAEGKLHLKGGDLIEVFVGQGGHAGGSGSAYGHGEGGASESGYSGGSGANPGPSGWSGGGGGGGGATVIKVNGVVQAVGGGGAGGGGGGNHSVGKNAVNTYGTFNPGDSYVLPTVYLSYAWGWFLNQYGVWHKSGAGADTTTYYVNFPVTGVYDFFFSADNYGYMEIDGEKILESRDYSTYATVSTTIGAGTRAVKIYAENWGGPAGFAGEIARGGTGFWTTREPTQPVIRSNGIVGTQTYGDEGGGGGGGGGYFGGTGGSRGFGDNGGGPGTLGKAYANGGKENVGGYSIQRYSSYPTHAGDGGIGTTGSPTDGSNGEAVLSFTISNRDIWNKVGNAWKNCKEVFVKTNGTWKKAVDVYVKKNGVWKKSLTHGGSITPSFTTDSVDWNTAFTPSVAPPPVTTTHSSYIAGISSGGCGPAIAYGTLHTNLWNWTFAGRAPVIKGFTPYNTRAARPTKTIAFRGANVTDSDLTQYGIFEDFNEVTVVRANERLKYDYAVWCDHGWTFGFYVGRGGNIALEYYDVFTGDYGASGRQHPTAAGEFVVPASFDANSVLICAFGDRRTGCPTGLDNLYINVYQKTY